MFSPEYLPTKSVLSCRRKVGANLRDIQESIFVLVLLVDAAHECRGRWQHLIDEDEDGLLWAELDTLADDIDELSDCKIRGH